MHEREFSPDKLFKGRLSKSLPNMWHNSLSQSDQELKEQDRLYCKSISLVKAEYAVQLGAKGVQKEDLVFIAHRENMSIGNSISPIDVYQVEEVFFSDDYDKQPFVTREGNLDFGGMINPNDWNGGKWIAMIEPVVVSNRSRTAKQIRVKEIRAICYFQWPGGKPHYKDLTRGLVVHDPSTNLLFPICDDEQHPYEIQPRRTFERKDHEMPIALLKELRGKPIEQAEIICEFSISEDGRVHFYDLPDDNDKQSYYKIR